MLKTLQYLALRELENITSALNFDTPDCRVVGGCDIYTTKAAGSDKKLYRNIENSLRLQYEQILKFSVSLSLPHSESLAESLNLSRSSPFGPLSQISSRRTFAYLIATLNASHPDYDFSHILRPSDFVKRKSLRSVMNAVDSTLYNLRPRPAPVPTPVTDKGHSGNIPQTPGGTISWSPKTWRLIDEQMDLKSCNLYSYVPEEDPFEGEEGALWSMNHFFFNKDRKRVCYLYLRGLSVLSHSPLTHTRRHLRHKSHNHPMPCLSQGAKKRAEYWLGNRANENQIESGTIDEDEDNIVAVDPADDEIEVESQYGVRDEYADEYVSSSDDMQSEYEADTYFVDAPRSMSQQIADSMEI